MYYNARSLLSKLDELNVVVKQQSQTLFVLLKHGWMIVSDSELSLDNYQLFRFDRNRHGGGVAIYVCNFLSCNII